MSKKNIVATKPALPTLPKGRSASGAGNGICMCGCKGETKSRFVAGHDATLLAWVIRVEKGVVKEAPPMHAAMVQIEIGLRRKAGTKPGQAHTRALISAEAIANAPKLRKAAKPVAKRSAVRRRPVTVPVEAPVTEAPAAE